MIDDNGSKPLEDALTKDYDDEKDYSLTVADGVFFRRLSEDERSYLINTFTSNRRRWRRVHQQALQQQERRAAKIKRLRALFLQDKTWAAQGGDILIKDMTPNHALNSYNLITREWGRYASVLFSDLETGYTNAHSTPLGQALFKRSQKRATWRDRRRDNESRERFKDRQAKSAAISASIWGTHEW